MNLWVVLGFFVVGIVIAVVYYHYHPREWLPIKMWFEGVYDYWINDKFFSKPIPQSY